MEVALPGMAGAEAKQIAGKAIGIKREENE